MEASLSGGLYSWVGGLDDEVGEGMRRVIGLLMLFIPTGALLVWRFGFSRVMLAMACILWVLFAIGLILDDI